MNQLIDVFQKGKKPIISEKPASRENACRLPIGIQCGSDSVTASLDSRGGIDTARRADGLAGKKRM
jgi:hypothetical protein